MLAVALSSATSPSQHEEPHESSDHVQESQCNMNAQCSQILTEANHLQVCAEVLQQLSELLQRCRNADQVLAEAGTLLGQAESELHHGGDQGSTSVCSAQVVAVLDDMMMQLAELQLQQEGDGSCAAALCKACSCIRHLQDTEGLSTAQSHTSSGTKHAVEAQAAWKASLEALKRDRAAVDAALKGLSEVLGPAAASTGVDASSDDACLVDPAIGQGPASHMLQQAVQQLTSLQTQQNQDLEGCCGSIQEHIDSLATYHSAQHNSTTATSPRSSKVSPRPSRLGKMSTPSSPWDAPLAGGSPADSMQPQTDSTMAAGSVPDLTAVAATPSSSLATAVAPHDVPQELYGGGSPAEGTDVLPAARQQAAPELCTAHSFLSPAASPSLQLTWQEELLHLQDRLQEAAQGSSNAVSSCDLQSACKTLLQYSQLLQQQQQQLEQCRAVPAHLPETLYRSCLDRDAASGSAIGGLTTTMRRWSNPVFSASGADCAPACRTSFLPIAPASGLSTSPAAAAAPAAPLMGTDSIHHRLSEDSSCLGDLDSEASGLPVWANAAEAAARPASFDAAEHAAYPGGLCGGPPAGAGPCQLQEEAQTSTHCHAAATACSLQACAADASAGGHCTAAPAAGMISVCIEEWESAEAISPHTQLQPPVLASRLLPCQLHDSWEHLGLPSPAATTPPANCAGVSAGTTADHPELAVSGSKAAMKTALRPVVGNSQLAESRGVACSRPVVVLHAVAEAAGGVQPIKPGTTHSSQLPGKAKAVGTLPAQQVPSKGILLQQAAQDLSSAEWALELSPASGQLQALQQLPHQALSQPLLQLLLTLQHASGVLAPAAMSGLSACCSGLAAEEVVSLHAAACSGVQDAARIHNVLQELVSKLPPQKGKEQAAQQDAPAAGDAGAAWSAEAGSTAAAAGAGAVVRQSLRQDSSDSWTIAAVHTGNRLSSSRESSLHSLGATLSAKYASDELEHLPEHGQGDSHPGALQPASSSGETLSAPVAAESRCTEPYLHSDEQEFRCTSPDGCPHTGSAVGGSGSAPNPAEPQEVSSTGRLPSLELIQSSASTGGLGLDDSSSLLCFGDDTVLLEEQAPPEPDPNVSAAGKIPAAAPTEPCSLAAAATAAGSDTAQTTAIVLLATDSADSCTGTGPGCHTGSAAAGAADDSGQHTQVLLLEEQPIPGPEPTAATHPAACDSSVCSTAPATAYSDAYAPVFGTAASPRESLSCIPPGFSIAQQMRKAMKGIKKQLHHSHHPAGRATEDLQHDTGSHTSDGTLQQQLLLVWSLRDQLAAAELKLQQHQDERLRSCSEPGGRRQHAVTAENITDGRLMQPRRATPRRHTCDTATFACAAASSTDAVQEALETLLEATVQSEAPISISASVLPDRAAAAQPAGTETTSIATHSPCGSDSAAALQGELHAVREAGAESMHPVAVSPTQEHTGDAAAPTVLLHSQPPAAETQIGTEQHEGHRLLQRLHSAQEHRLTAEAMQAVVEHEFAAITQQRGAAELHVQDLQQALAATQQQLAAAQAAQAALEQQLADSNAQQAADEQAALAAEADLLLQLTSAQQQLEREQQTAAELQQQLMVARARQGAAEAVAALVQREHDFTQQQLVQAQQHEQELEQQQLHNTLQHLESAACTAESAAQQLLQEAQMQDVEHDSPLGAAAVQVASCLQQREASLQQQLEEARQEQQQLQELLAAHQKLLLQLQDAAAQVSAEDANLQSSWLQERQELQQQVAAEQQANGQLQQQLQQQGHMLDAAQEEAAQAASRATQQLEKAQAEIQRLSELLALHDGLILRLQQLQQEVDSAAGAAAAAAVTPAVSDVGQPSGSVAAAAEDPAACQFGGKSDAATTKAGSAEVHGSYSGQVIEQLASQVDRLLAEQAAAEGLHSQLAAATERNAALQGEVRSLTAAVAKLQRRAQCPAVPAPAPAANTQQLKLNISPPVAAEVAVAAPLEADSSGEHLHEWDATQQEHVSLQLMQQQLQQAEADTAATTAEATRLQAELQAAQECERELRNQLQSLAATLADAEARAASNLPPALQQPPQLTTHSQQLQEEGVVSADAAAMDAATSDALIQELSHAINKQAQLQELLQQRDRQLLALTSAQLCSNGSQPAAAVAAVEAIANAGVQVPVVQLPQLAASSNTQSSLVQEVAALLAAASSPEPAAAAAAAACVPTPQCDLRCSDSRSCSLTGVQDSESAAQSAGDLSPCPESSTSIVSQDASTGLGQACGTDNIQVATAPDVVVATPQEDPTARATAENLDLLTWGSIEGRHTPGLRHSSSSTQAGGCQPAAAAAAAAADSDGYCSRQDGVTNTEGLWGTTDGTQDEVVVALLPDLSLCERELQQLKTQLAERSATLAATAAQLTQLQAAHAQQTDQLAGLLRELSTVQSESTHRVAAAEAAVTALQAAAQAREHPAPMNNTAGHHLSASSTADESTPAEATSQCEASLTQPAWARAAAIAGGSDAVELPPSTEASQLHLDVSHIHSPGHPTVAAGDAHSLLQPCGGPVPCVVSAEQPSNTSAAGGIIQPAQQAAVVVGAGQAVPASALTPAAAAATASLLVAARVALARAAAGESREQQLLQEVSLQHELHELQQQELTVLKQRLAASEQEASRLSTQLQSKQRQLQQLQTKLTALKQQQQQEGAQIQPIPGLQQGRSRYGQQSAAAGGSPVGCMRSPAVPGAAYGTVQHPVQLAAAPAAYTSYARASITDMQAACQSSSPASPSASRATGCAASDSTSPTQQADSAGAAASTAYAHAEEVRRLNRELVAKERCIASLQAANRLHKQQLQQLATSATDAGLMVTPQHLLHVADDKTPGCTKGCRPAVGAFQVAIAGAVATAAGASRIPSRPLPVQPASAASGAAARGTPVKISLPCKLTSGAGAQPSTPLAGHSRGQQTTSRIPAAAGCDAGLQSGLQAAAAAGAQQSGTRQPGASPLEQLRQQRQGQQAAQLRSPHR